MAKEPAADNPWIVIHVHVPVKPNCWHDFGKQVAAALAPLGVTAHVIDPTNPNPLHGVLD